MIKSKRLLAAGLAASLVLAACGGDDDAPADEPTADEGTADEGTADATEETGEPEPTGESFNGSEAHRFGRGNGCRVLRSYCIASGECNLSRRYVEANARFHFAGGNPVHDQFV